MSIEQSRYIQHLRSEIMNSKEDAIIKLQDMMSALNMERADGVQLISRYRSNDKIISLVGIVAVDENSNSDITIVNAEETYVTKDEFQTAINELKEQINNNSGSTDNTEEKDEFGSGYDIDNDYWIHCEYDITNVGNKTILYSTYSDQVRISCSRYVYDVLGGVTDKILAMKIDGVECNINYYHKFDTLGKHTVDFLLKETTYLPDGMFYGVNRLTKIIIPFSIEKIGYYSLGKCEKLELIQFNNKNQPIILYNAFYEMINEKGLLKIYSSIDKNEIIGEKEMCEFNSSSGVSTIKVWAYNKIPTTWNVEYID